MEVWLLAEISFPQCKVLSVGNGFLGLIQERVRDGNTTYEPEAIRNLLTGMTLYDLIHPEDVQVKAYVGRYAKFVRLAGLVCRGACVWMLAVLIQAA